MNIIKARVIEYDTSKYNFREWASSILGIPVLEKIHERPDIQSYTDIQEQIKVCRSKLEDRFETCQPIYFKFIHQIIAPLYNGIISYQIPPTFRFHYSGKGTTSFHRDRDYGVERTRINGWLPLTRVWGTNSIWIESEEGKDDFAPVELDYGQVLLFDGANLSHGSKVNRTDSTRVSFDFRFAPNRTIFRDDF